MQRLPFCRWQVHLPCGWQRFHRFAQQPQFMRAIAAPPDMSLDSSPFGGGQFAIDVGRELLFVTLQHRAASLQIKMIEPK
jgi:hypothetical protein